MPAALPELPAALLASSRRAGNGERAWPVEAVEEVAAWLLDHGRELNGGEVYELVGEVQWGTFRSDWRTEPPWRPGGEEWSAYRERTLGRLRDELADLGEAAGRCRVYLAAFPRHDDSGRDQI